MWQRRMDAAKKTQWTGIPNIWKQLFDLGVAD